MSICPSLTFLPASLSHFSCFRYSFCTFHHLLSFPLYPGSPAFFPPAPFSASLHHHLTGLSSQLPFIRNPSRWLADFPADERSAGSSSTSIRSSGALDRLYGDGFGATHLLVSHCFHFAIGFAILLDRSADSLACHSANPSLLGSTLLAILLRHPAYSPACHSANSSCLVTLRTVLLAILLTILLPILVAILLAILLAVLSAVFRRHVGHQISNRSIPSISNTLGVWGFQRPTIYIR